MHVLVVEDSALVRTRLVNMLSTIRGVMVWSAAGIAESARFLAARPGVAVLDVRLPDGSGVDLLRAIRTAALPCVVVMLTNDPSPQMKASCLGAGADYFLDKSSEFEQVPLIVAELARGGTSPR